MHVLLKGPPRGRTESIAEGEHNPGRFSTTPFPCEPSMKHETSRDPCFPGGLEAVARIRLEDSLRSGACLSAERLDIEIAAAGAHVDADLLVAPPVADHDPA